MSFPRRTLPWLLLACCWGTTAVSAAGVALGLVLSPDRASELEASPGDSPPPPVSLRMPWPGAAFDSASHDWSPVDAAVAALARGGRDLTLELDAELPSAVDKPALEAWLAFVRAAVARYGDRARTFQIGARLDARDLEHAEGLALVLKQSALAVRAEARSRGTTVAVALPALPASEVELRRALWSSDLAAYADLLPVALDAEADRAGELAALAATIEENLLHPPAMRVRALVGPSADWTGVALGLEALARGAEAAFVTLEGNSPAGVPAWVVGVHRWLAADAADYLPAPAGTARIEALEGTSGRGHVLGRFFGEREFTTLIPYTTGSASSAWEPAPLRLVLDALAVRDARIIDPLTGEERRVSPLPAGRGEVAIALYESDSPRLVVFALALQPGLDLPPTELEVASSRALTAEEIIARYQEVQREQDQRFERLLARGVVDFHFRIAEGGSTVDVTIDSQYFLERGGQLEWEQLDYRINGSRVGWKDFPQLPLIQPEKVITLPLDLTLDRSYAYRLRGEERVRDRLAWVLEFEPVAPDSSLALYRGRVWIDQERFVRLKVALVQGDLEAPVISNEETDIYAEHQGPDGTYWLLTEIEGQQVWNVAGRSFVVQRELRFSEFRINPPAEEFTARRDAAYASRNTMLRDTDQGFRYLDRTDDGGRVVQEEVVSRQIFAAGGMFRDGARDETLPLAGVDYFDYDLFDQNVQLNVLFAGVLAVVNVSKPDLAHGRLDLTLDGVFTAVGGDDRVYAAGVEQAAERLEVLPQRMALRTGLPLGAFWKLNFILGADWRSYSSTDEQEDAIAAYQSSTGQALDYVLPRDHAVMSAALEASFNRRGWSFVAEATEARRSTWESWGLRDVASGTLGQIDPASGTFVATGGDPVHESYSRWGATVFRDWFLPRFQKLRGELSWLDGDDLDRFSRHQFSYFGSDRLNGFSGSGVRFDDGGIARAGYSFNLFGAVRFDANFDWARVRDRSTEDGFLSFGGVGVNGNFPAPWKTIVNVSYGRALVSDIPELEGDDEFLLLVLKLF